MDSRRSLFGCESGRGDVKPQHGGTGLCFAGGDRRIHSIQLRHQNGGLRSLGSGYAREFFVVVGILLLEHGDEVVAGKVDATVDLVEDGFIGALGRGEAGDAGTCFCIQYH